LHRREQGAGRGLAEVCPNTQVVRGDRFASVAQGLGLHAQRLFA
jgi:hypothetical protein